MVGCVEKAISYCCSGVIWEVKKRCDWSMEVDENSASTQSAFSLLVLSPKRSLWNGGLCMLLLMFLLLEEWESSTVKQPNNRNDSVRLEYLTLVMLLWFCWCCGVLCCCCLAFC